MSEELNIETERPAFELQYAYMGLERDINGKYVSGRTADMWHAWCSSILAARPVADAGADNTQALNLLRDVFDAWENGVDCHEGDGDDAGAYLGKAFQLPDETFHACCDLLNRKFPHGFNADCAAPSARMLSDEAVTLIIRDVCELDYPDGFDEENILAVTVSDLRLICERHIAAASTASAPSVFANDGREPDWAGYAAAEQAASAPAATTLGALQAWFDKHATAKYGDGPEVKRNEAGRYVYAHVQNEWESLLAAASAQAAVDAQKSPAVNSNAACSSSVEGNSVQGEAKALMVEAYSYQELFDAIAAATKNEGIGIAISVKAFRAALPVKAGDGVQSEAKEEPRFFMDHGLWDYGPGQDEHAKCDDVAERCRAVLGGAPFVTDPLTITGEVVEIGRLEGENGADGFVLKRPDGSFVTAKGVTEDEVRAVAAYYGKTITVRAALAKMEGKA